MKLLDWINKEEKNDAETSVEAIETSLHTNKKPVIFAGFAVLIGGFLGFIIWAAFAPMTKGTNMPGTVTTASNEIVLQSRYGGTIKEVVAREGQTVKKKQPILLLEDAQQKSNLASVKSRYITYLAMYGRLMAEDGGKSGISFPSALYSFKGSNQAQEAMATQKELFNTETINFNAEKSILRVNITGLKSYVENLKQLKISTLNQMNLAQKEIKPLKKLASEGYYPKVKVIEMESSLAQLNGRLNEETGDLSRAEGSLSEDELKLDNLRNNFLKNVNKELNDVQSMVFSLKQQYKAALNQVKNSRVSSPSKGIVVKIFNKTVGGAVMPGQPIVDVIPLHQNLIVKGDIPAQYIARIHKGLSADLRFPAFDVADIPVISGRVIYVSANSMANPVNHVPFYECKIKINSKGLKTLARRKLKLKAGMPAEVTVKTGAKTLLGELLNPLMYKITNAFVK